MRPWIIFDKKCLPKKSLTVEGSVFYSQKGYAEGELIHRMKKDLAMQLADKIMADPQFFEMRDLSSCGLLSVKASVVVMTESEFRSEVEYQFSQGRDAGVCMIPPHKDLIA